MKVKDPVCEMMIDEETAPAKSEYQGKTNYFCSNQCKEEFDADPGAYDEEMSARRTNQTSKPERTESRRGGCG